MDLIKDIKEIIKNDTNHNLKINISSLGVTVYLDYDPCGDYKEETMIPIAYTTLDEFAYIPNDEYRSKYNAEDYGIDLEEINLIKAIMEYLESHSKEINELCAGFQYEDRERGTCSYGNK